MNLSNVVNVIKESRKDV